MSAVSLPSPAASPTRRIIGLDIARGLAVIGMFGAHLLTFPRQLLWNPSSWIALVDGRSAILFAFLAGISLAIMTGRQTPVTGEALMRARMRIIVRALLIYLISGVLTLYFHPILVVLEAYAIAFALSLPFLGWRPRHLLIGGVTLLIAVPVVRVILSNLYFFWTNFSPDGSPVYQVLMGGMYPAVLWLGFMMIGLAVGRHDLASRSFQLKLIVIGLVTCVAFYSAGEYLEGKNGINASEAASREAYAAATGPASGGGVNVDTGEALDSADDAAVPDYYAEPKTLAPADLPSTLTTCKMFAPSSAFCGTPDSIANMYAYDAGTPPEQTFWGSVRDELGPLGTWAPHSQAPFESIGSIGFAAALLGVCLMLPRLLTTLLSPLAAVGSMALSAYTFQVLAFIWYQQSYTHPWRDYGIFVLVTLVACWMWRRLWGTGPLERIVSGISKRASNPKDQPAAIPPATS